jgi:oxygen-independent coproporphyrinogen-3 oxidase
LFAEGIDRSAFARRFGTSLADAMPWLDELEGESLARWHGELLCLTPVGLELTDAIGPWLFSDDVAAKMRAWEAR